MTDAELCKRMGIQPTHYYCERYMGSCNNVCEAAVGCAGWGKPPKCGGVHSVKSYPTGDALLVALKAALMENIYVMWFRVTYNNVRKTWDAVINYNTDSERVFAAKATAIKELDALKAACKAMLGKEVDRWELSRTR